MEPGGGGREGRQRSIDRDIVEMSRKHPAGLSLARPRTPFKGRRCIDLAIVTDDRDVIATESIIHDPLSLGDSSIPTCNWDQRLSGSAHRVPPPSRRVYPLRTPLPLLRVRLRRRRCIRAVAIFCAARIKASRSRDSFRFDCRMIFKFTSPAWIALIWRYRESDSDSTATLSMFRVISPTTVSTCPRKCTLFK